MYFRKAYKVVITLLMVVVCLLSLASCRNKKVYDMSNISFNDYTAVYDGKEHILETLQCCLQC